MEESSLLKSDVPLYIRGTDNSPIHRLAPKLGRNYLCPLEGKKFKRCCGIDGSNFCKKLLNQFIEKNTPKNDQSS
jgi:hypothetical protein